MADSLRDQLLKSGIVKQVREERRPNAPKGGRVPPHKQVPKARGVANDEVDLAKAYAIRARAEANERKQAEREAAEQARLKRERKQKIQQLLQGKALNKPDADQVRHFEYSGKIRRVYVDAAQLAALNGGELGIVQQAGRYLLVERAIAEQVRGIDEHLLALLLEPGSGGIGDDGVPDDLMW